MKLLNGLNRDTAHVDQPGGTYRRARNMILDDLAGALATERAPLKIEALSGANELFQNMQICGQYNVPGDNIVFGIKARATTTNTYWDTSQVEQIIKFNSAEQTFTVLGAGPEGAFGFDADHPFQGVSYINGAGHTVLVWTNGKTPPRYVIYKGTTLTTSLPLFPEARFPMVRPFRDGAGGEGEVLAGTYSFILAYETIDNTDNITQYGPSMGAFKFGTEATDEEKKFRCSVQLKFYNLDTTYNYARVYAVRTYNGVETVTYADRFPIAGQTEVAWTYYGQDTRIDPGSVDGLLIPRPTYTSAATAAVSDDRLFLGNLTTDEISNEEGQAIANNISVRWCVDHVGATAAEYDTLISGQSINPALRSKDYTNANWTQAFYNRNSDDNKQPVNQIGQVYDDWQGLLGGFMPNEVYALYIAFLKNDGTWSQAFHIPGGGASGNFSDTSRLMAASESVTTYAIGAGGGTTTAGLCGYSENSSEEYPTTTAFTNAGLAGEPVRHHVMPSPKQMYEATTGAQSDLNAPTYNNGYEEEWCAQHLGLFFDNVVIPTGVLSKVQGWQVFYAKPRNIDDRRVKAYVPTNRWAGTVDASEQDVLRIYDPYLLASKPALIGHDIEEVYKNLSYSEEAGYSPAMQASTIEDFGYMPSNVDHPVFPNEYREQCLGIKLGEDVVIHDNSTSTDWAAGYPGYLAGLNGAKFFSGANPVWHSQVVDDVFTDTYPTTPLNGGGSILNDNFVSLFGSFQQGGGANTGYPFEAGTYVARPSKTTNTYKLVPDYPLSDAVTNVVDHDIDWYQADDVASGVTAGNSLSQSSGDSPFLGFGGAMGGFSMIKKDYDDYFINYEAWELCATNDLVHVTTDTATTSNQVVHGGDTWITPVIVEFMSSGSFTRANSGTTPGDANSEASYDAIGKLSYFTWSHAPVAKNDLDGIFDWNDLNNDWGVGTLRTPFYGETFNSYNFGAHWFELNTFKSAFPAQLNTLASDNYSNRIIRSAKQGYESTSFNWGIFAAIDYYDNALGKRGIRNLEDYQGELIIHHEDGIFKTRSKFNIDASSTSVFVGSGDIFAAAPQELIPDVAGYGGISAFTDSVLCRHGYIWLDRVAGKVFKLGGQLDELSAKGLANFFRDEYVDTSDAINPLTSITAADKGGYAIGFDPTNERLLVTKRYCNGQAAVAPGNTAYSKTGDTISYSFRNQCWASHHTFDPYFYFQSYTDLYAFNEVQNAGVQTGSGSTNLAAVFKLNGAAPGIMYDLNGDVRDDLYNSSFVDIVFNMGGPVSKVWQNFNWVTRNGEGEGTSGRSVTFDEARVYNDDQASAVRTNFRLTDNRWQFNEFRDLRIDGQPIFAANNYDFNANNQLLDVNRPWYEQKKFVSEFAVLRLEALNTEGNRLYLLDVGATARRATR